MAVFFRIRKEYSRLYFCPQRRYNRDAGGGGRARISLSVESADLWVDLSSLPVDFSWLQALELYSCYWCYRSLWYCRYPDKNAQADQKADEHDHTSPQVDDLITRDRSIHIRLDAKGIDPVPYLSGQ